MGASAKNTRRVTLWPGQQRLLTDKTKLSQVCFAGVGYGKTTFGCRWIATRTLWNLKSRSRKNLIIAPTYKLLRHNHLNRYQDALREFGLLENVHYHVNRADLIVEFNKETAFDYKTFLISGENYKNIVSWEFDCAWWDEPGFSPLELCEFVDQRVGRTQGCEVGQVLYTGVIQIPNWYFDRFGADPRLAPVEYYQLPAEVDPYAPGYAAVPLVRHRESKTVLCMHASTFENPTLRKDYFIRQYENYGWDIKKFEAHVIGKAVAANKDAVYDKFDETASVGDYPFDCRGHNPFINLTFDFNVGQMSAAVVQQYGRDHIITWLNSPNCLTTEDACDEFLRAFPGKIYGNRSLRVFGDPAGWNRSTQFRSRDGNYAIIKAKLRAEYPNLEIKAPHHSVPQETRVMSTNRLLAAASRRKSFASDASPALYVDRKCRRIIDGWRGVCWDKKTGAIAKGSNDTLTHAPEAVDFYLYVVEPPILTVTSAGY